MFFIMLFSEVKRQFVPTMHGPFETCEQAQIVMNESLSHKRTYIARKRKTISGEEIYEKVFIKS